MPSESNTIEDFGKSITNDFNITVANLVVTEDAFIEGDLTVLGAITFDNVNINNLDAVSATITDLTLENPLPTLSGGTGLATIGTAGQVLSVNSTGTGLVYTSNTEGAVTAVSASSPLSSSGGSTPTISIPLTTGTGSTVVLKNAPTFIGPVIVEGDINAENLTLENPLPTLIGGTGLTTIGTAGQVLSVNSTATGLVYTSNTAGSVTEVSALSPLSSSGGSTPTISIPLTTGTGSTVVLKNAPDLIGPVTVEGDINAENGSIGLVARHDVTEPSASISMNTFSSKNSRIRTTNDVEFRIDNIGQGQRKKMKLMADSVTVTRLEGNELNDGFYVDLPTTIRNETFIRETYCSEMLNFPQSVSLPNENGIRMYNNENQNNPRFELGITSGDNYPFTSSSYFKIADVSGVFNVSMGTGSVSYSLGTGNFSVSTVTLGNINFLCAGVGAVTAQTAGIGGISLACAGTGAISIAATSGLISLTSGTVMTLTATTSITHTAPTSIFNSFCVMNRTVNISGLLSCQGGASISGGTKFFGAVACGGGITVTGTTQMNGPTNVTAAFTVTGSSTVSGAGTFRGGLTIQGATTATGAVTVNGPTKFNGPSNITGVFTVTGNSTFTGNTTIKGSLQANGNFGFTGPVAISGNLAVFGIVSISRELKVFQGITITGKTNAIGPVSIIGKTDISGAVGITGTTTIKGFTSIAGNMTVTGTGTIQGKGTVRGGLEVNGGAKIFMGLDVNGTSKFTGQATVIGTLTVSGKSTLNGGISVTGAGSIVGNFTVSGLGTINGITRCNAGLSITGATNATGLVNITGATKITGALNVTGSISSQGAFTLQGGGNITGALGVQGATSITGALVVAGPTSTSGLFTATGGAAITGLTFITGATQISGALNISGSLSTQGVATFLSSTYMVNGIGVTGGVTINTVGQRCDITGGKVTIKSEVDAVNIIAPEGGFNIGSSFAGGVVGAVRIETQNGFTQFATANIDIRTTTQGSYTGNGNISLNTLSAYSGNIFIAAKGVLAFGAANQGSSQTSAATEFISIDTSLVSAGGYTLKFPANIGTLNSIFLSGGSSSPLSWLAPGAANTYLQSDGTSLSWVAASSFTDWANPGTIGSTTPNTGAFTTLSATGSSAVFTLGVLNVTNTTTSAAAVARFMTPNLPSGVQTVLSLGRSSSTNDAAEFSFSPNTDTSLISTAWGFYGGAGAKITLRPSSINLNVATTITGNLNVSNGNIFTNQNIINGISIVTSGNLALTAASPGIILVRTGGGSGSVITLPNASTLISGYQYTINNNSNFNVIVNRNNSGLVGTIIPGNCAQITCIETTGANGQWDIHISGTDWANPGTIGSEIPNTGAFTTLSATANSTVFTSGVLNVTNTAVVNANIASFYTPNLPSGGGTILTFGKSATANEAVEFTYNHNTTLNSRSSTWGFYGGAGSKITLRPTEIFFDNAAVSISGATTVSGVFRANGTIPSIPTGSGVFMGLDPVNNFSGIQLNNIVGSYIDFSISGGDFNARISSLNTGKTLDYYADKHSFFNSSATLNYFSINDGGFAARINGTCGVVSNLSVNSTNISSNTNLNPAVFVFSDGPTLGNSYGMDLGYNATSARYRTRIFAPASGSAGDIALSIGQRVTGATQSSYFDRLVIRGDTGNIELNGPTTISGAGNVSGLFRAFGGMPNSPVGNGVFMGNDTIGNYAVIQLNNITGSYIDFSSSGVDNNARIICQNTGKSLTYEADSHSFNRGKTFINSDSNAFASGVLNVTNSAAASGSGATFMTPNLPSGGEIMLALGKSATNNEAVQFSYIHNTTLNSRAALWGFYGGAGSKITLRPNEIFFDNSPVSVFGGVFRAAGTIPVSPVGNGVFIGLDVNNYSGIQLNNTIGSYIDFSSSGVDFNARILCNNSNKNLEYIADAHVFGGPVVCNTSLEAANLKNGATQWFANANVFIPHNSWRSITNLFVSRQGGSVGLTWINQGTGFRNTSGRGLLVTGSFCCQRVNNGFGVTAVRFWVNNNFSLGTQDVAALDSVVIAGTTFLGLNETIQCQIYQNSGIDLDFANINVNFTYTTFY